ALIAATVAAKKKPSHFNNRNADLCIILTL
ncbi:MAG: hypothetical protein ACI9MK_000542, partial [Oceanospirillaceae bacterium]